MNWRLLLIFLLPLAQASDSGDMQSSVMNTLIDSFSTLMPLLFRVYNYGILAVLSVMAGFTILFGGAVAAAEGAGIARKINAWVVIRTLIGASLLVPTGVKDYALIQKVILKIVSFSLTMVLTMLTGITDSLGINDLSKGIYPSDHIAIVKQVDKVNQQYKNLTKLAYAAAIEGSKIQNAQIRVIELESSRGDVQLAYEIGNNSCYQTNSCQRIGTVSLSKDKYAQSPVVKRVMDQALRSAYASVIAMKEGFRAQLIDAVADEDIEALKEKISEIVGSSGESTGTVPTIREIQEKYNVSLSNYTPNTSCGRGAICWDNAVFNPGYEAFAYLKAAVMPECIQTPDGRGCQAGALEREILTLEEVGEKLPVIMDALLPGSQDYSAKESVVKGAIAQYIDAGIKIEYTGKVPEIKNFQDFAQACKESSNPVSCLKREFDQALEYNLLISTTSQLDNMTIGLQYGLPSQLRSVEAPNELKERTRFIVNNIQIDPRAAAHNIAAAKMVGESGEALAKVEEDNHYLGLEQDSSYYHYSSYDLNVVPREINKMLATVLSAITGINRDGSTSPGLLTYNQLKGNEMVNPVMFLQTIGEKIYEAGINFNSVAIRGDQGAIAIDDELTQMVYGGTSAVLAPARGISAGLQATWPLTGWTRGWIFLTHGLSANLMQLQGFLADLDQFILYKFEPLGSALSMLFLMWGAFFGIFLPAVPFMVILFSLIGWVLLIVEAMIASPLVALGLAHPNSQQFLGASDQVLMMLLLVAIRPLMIAVAIFFSCVLAYAAIYFLNEGAAQVLLALGVAQSAPGSIGALDVAIFISSMLVYSYLLFLVVVQAFSFIGSLPDKVGVWIGMGPMGGTSPLQQVLSVRQSFEGGMQMAASGLKDMGAKAKSLRGSHSDMVVSADELRKQYRGGKSRDAMAKDIDDLKSDEKTGKDKSNIRQGLLRGLKGADLESAKQVLDSGFTSLQKADVIREIRECKYGQRSIFGMTTYDRDGNKENQSKSFYSPRRSRATVQAKIDMYNDQLGGGGNKVTMRYETNLARDDQGDYSVKQSPTDLAVGSVVGRLAFFTNPSWRGLAELPQALPMALAATAFLGADFMTSAVQRSSSWLDRSGGNSQDG